MLNKDYSHYINNINQVQGENNFNKENQIINNSENLVSQTI